jgi:hypothetical protein
MEDTIQIAQITKGSLNHHSFALRKKIGALDYFSPVADGESRTVS